MKKISAGVLPPLLALLLLAGGALPMASAAGFSDVPDSHAFYEAVMVCASKGIASGYGDGSFRPGDPVTRAQFCAMLSRAFYPQRMEALGESGGVWFLPGAQALFEAGVLEGTGFAGGFAGEDVMGQTISRYDMARMISNVITAGGFQASAAERSAARAGIADYGSIPGGYRDAVENVFALGIITGYGDGGFHGDAAMNRGQGCVVIYRVTRFVPIGGGASLPGAAEPAERTLADGRAVTEENVAAILSRLKAQYPQKAEFTGYPEGGGSADVKQVYESYRRAADSSGVNSLTGSGGWGALVSDAIFGQSGFPARRTDLADVRPGDLIIVRYNEEASHVAVATSRAARYQDPDRRVSGETYVETTEVSTHLTETEAVYWTLGTSEADNQSYGCLEVWTRYPE